MTNQLIKTCQELAECEGMGDSPWRLYRHSNGKLEVYSEHDFRTCWEDNDIVPVEGICLKIDDLSEWSSAKILKRAGWDASRETIYDWVSRKKFRSNLEYKDWLQQIRAISKALKEGNHELAYMQAIILLYKIDREAYNKGIEPLLEGKG